MSRTTNRLAFTAVATVGLLWPVLVLSATATAEPAASPGVPCLDMVQNFAAAPSAIPESLQTAASALGAPEQAAALPPVPVTSLLGRPDGRGRAQPRSGGRRRATTSTP
jgi:hypothetical protein